jgi:hypothetical protein
MFSSAISAFNPKNELNVMVATPAVLMIAT